MSVTRDPDRILRAWLDLMPDEAPDRALDAVLQAIPTTPQLRRPWQRPFWRSSSMNRLGLAAATIAIVIVGAVVLIQRPATDSVAGQSPTAPPSSIGPSATANSSAPSSQTALGPVPAALQHRWMGGPGTHASGGAGTSLLFGAGGVVVSPANQNNQTLLKATVSAAAPDQLLVTTAEPSAGGCTAAQTGTYTWSLNESGRTLSFSRIDDPCANRQDALGGTWWLEGCQDATDNCLGLLDAGAYASEFVATRAKSGTPWTPIFGALTYAVPSGWANDADWPGLYELAPASSFARWIKDTGVPSAISVLSDGQPELGSTPCSGKPDSAVGSTVADLVDSLRSKPGLTVTAANPITIGGMTGLTVDLATKDNAIKPCGGEHVVELMIAGGSPIAIKAGERQRLIVLGAGATRLVIQIYGPDDAAYSAFVGQAMHIVESMQFK